MVCRNANNIGIQHAERDTFWGNAGLTHTKTATENIVDVVTRFEKNGRNVIITIVI